MMNAEQEGGEFLNVAPVPAVEGGTPNALKPKAVVVVIGPPGGKACSVASFEYLMACMSRGLPPFNN